MNPAQAFPHTPVSTPPVATFPANDGPLSAMAHQLPPRSPSQAQLIAQAHAQAQAQSQSQSQLPPQLPAVPQPQPLQLQQQLQQQASLQPAGSSGSFLSQIEEIRTPFPLQPGSVEAQRLQMLNRAREGNDLFYVVFHALFCARSVNANLQLPNLSISHLHGLDLMAPFLVNNKHLMEQFILFCSSCPGPIDFMLQIFPQYREALNDVLNFLQLMGDNWQHFEQTMGPRGYPPLIHEFTGSFMLKSKILQHVIFTACCRRLCGGPDDSWLKVYNQIFYRDDMMQAAHAKLLRMYGMTQPVLRQIEADKGYIKEAYIKVRHHQMVHLSRQSTQSQHARSASVSDSRPHQIINASPDLPRRQHSLSQLQFPSPREHQSPRPSPSLGGMFQSRNTTPIQVASLQGPGSMLLPNSASVQNQSALAASNGAANFINPAAMGIPSPTAHHPLTAQPPTPSFQPHSRTSSLATAVPFTSSMPLPHAGSVPAQQNATAAVYTNSPIAQAPSPFATNPYPQTGYALYDRQQPQQQHQQLQQPQPQPQQHQQLQQPQQQYQQQPQPQPQLQQHVQWQQPQPQRFPQYQVPKIPMFPPPNFTPALFANPNPLLVGLHETHLKRLYRSLDEDGTVNNSLNLFQYMQSFAIPPVPLPPGQPSLTWNLTVPGEVFAQMPKPLETRHGRTIYGRGDGSRMYHLRCTRSMAPAMRFSDHAWAPRETKWPGCIYVDVNGEAQQVRHSNHHGKDLPLDITPCIREGNNEIKITVIHSPSRSATPPTYFFAVETITNANMQRALGAVGSLSTSESIQEIDDRLATSLRNDDELSLLDDFISIDLFDPFMARIFNVPARGKFCGHRDCFDLQTFLDTRLNRRDNEAMAGNWKCPVCSKDCRPTSLIIDDFLLDVKRGLEERNELQTTRAILVRKGGAWEVKGDKSTSPPSRNAAATATSPDNDPHASSRIAAQTTQDGSNSGMKTESGLPNRSSKTAIEVIELD